MTTPSEQNSATVSMNSLQTMFLLGMKSQLSDPLPVGPGLVLNLGAGSQVIPDTVPLDYERGWDADTQPLPYPDGTVDGIHAYHFFEHVRDPIAVLRECERVMRGGAVLQLGVPHYLGQMAYQDLDHKHFFTTETWQKLFANPYYNKFQHTWRFTVHLNVIMGTVERNLFLLTQLVRLCD